MTPRAIVKAGMLAGFGLYLGLSAGRFAEHALEGVLSSATKLLVRYLGAIDV